MQRPVIFCLAFGLLLGIAQQAFAQNTENPPENMLFQEVKIALAGTAETRADYFAGQGPQAVIFAPGAIYTKESWHFFAKRFQELGISSISLNSGSTPDLLNAIAFLKAKGARKITIIGASAGGAGVLSMLQETFDPLVASVVLLAPAGGKPLRNDRLRKLFIVAEDDVISSSAEVYRLYMGSAEPKTFKEFKGSDDAQRIFDSAQKDNVMQLIIDFIQN